MFSFYTVYYLHAMKWYVYRLSYKSIVFYIGLTGNMINRYKEHYIGNVPQTSGLINLIRCANHEHIDMDVLHILDCRHTAFQLERANIRMYANQNIPLCNDKWNDIDNIMFFSGMTEWHKPKRASYSQINEIIQQKINKHESNRCKQMDYSTSVGE